MSIQLACGVGIDGTCTITLLDWLNRDERMNQLQNGFNRP